MTARTVWETAPDPDASLRLCQIDYDPGGWQPKHHHDRAQVTLVCRGSVEERAGRRRASGGPLSVAVKPAGIEHADRIGPRGAHTLQLSVAPALLADAEPADRLAWSWLDGGPVVARLVELLRLARDDAPEAASLEAAAYDALASVAGRRPRRHARAPEWARRVGRLVDDAFAAPVTVGALAAAVGVHPVTLARAYRAEHGCSITERWAFLRTREAARRLLESDESAPAVALAAGFADQSHMCRVFRRVTGLTPGRYRRALRGA